VDAQVHAYRRTFVGLGISSPAFVEEVRLLSPDGAWRVAEVAKQYPV